MTLPEQFALREQISDLERYVSGLPEELRDGAYGLAYRGRLDMLYDELATIDMQQIAKDANAPVIDLRLSGFAIKNKVRASFYGTFLHTWQWLYWSLGQAAAGKPTTRGSIPRDIVEQTQLDVIATAPGSFVTRLLIDVPKQPYLPHSGTPLAIVAFGELEALLSAGGQQESLRVIMHRLKGRVLSAYIGLVDLLGVNGVGLDIKLAVPGESQVRRADLSLAKALTIAPLLGQIAKIESNPIEVVGVLNMANRRTGSFEIDLGEEGTVTGRHEPSLGLLNGATIGSTYLFNLTELVSRDDMTGHIDTAFVLDRAPVPISVQG
jgi:hypothetical protein